MKERSEKYKLADEELERGIDNERQTSLLKRQAPGEQREQSKHQGREQEKQQDRVENRDLLKSQEPSKEAFQELKYNSQAEHKKEFKKEGKIDNDLDPESAKWAAARAQGKQEQAEKVKAFEQEKARKLIDDPWGKVQVEGYNKAGYQEELAQEKAKEQGRSAEQEKGKAKS